MKKIVTGGQTGVDRAAMDVCLERQIPLGGWCPRGRLAEDGPIAEHYPLQETDSSETAVRTEWNVRDSDGTLVLTMGRPTDGTPLTERLARRYGRPLLIVDIEAAPKHGEVVDWISAQNIQVLNVAGPRESHAPGQVYRRAREVLESVFSLIFS